MDELVESLVIRARAGDRGAFAQLVARFSTPLFRLAHSVVAQREEAEDVVQETFLQVFLHLSDLREARAFEGWLRRTAVRLALNRVQRTKPTVSIDDLPADSAVLATSGDPTGRAIELHAAMEALAGCLADLPEVYRVTLLLREQGALSYEEIAEALGIPVGTVRSRLATARQRLQACMQAAGHPGSAP